MDGASDRTNSLRIYQQLAPVRCSFLRKTADSVEKGNRLLARSEQSRELAAARLGATETDRISVRLAAVPAATPELEPACSSRLISATHWSYSS
jgi:hypothetical protein